jgi:hypothetical protein
MPHLYYYSTHLAPTHTACNFALLSSWVVVMDPRIPLAANVGPPEDFAQEILREFDFGVDYDLAASSPLGVWLFFVC